MSEQQPRRSWRVTRRLEPRPDYPDLQGEAVLTISVDLDDLLRTMGHRAVANRQATAVYGAVVVRCESWTPDKAAPNA